MSRTSKLYDRLGSLEAEFKERLLCELRLVADGNWSRFLSRQTSLWPEGHTFLDPNTCELEKMAKDILSLREKLGEPTDVGPVALVEDYCSQHHRKDWCDGGEEAVARELIQRISGNPR